MPAFNPIITNQRLRETSWLTNAVHATNRCLAKWSFSGSIRLDFYRALLLLIDNQVRLNEALKELYRIYSNEGKNRTEAVAMVIEDCLAGMNNGLAFTERLAYWIPAEEGMLLQSGEASGALAAAFNEAEKIMTAKKQIVGAISGAVSYPIVLFSLTGFLLNMIATELVPKLAQVVDPQQWVGAAAILYHIAEFVNHYGLITVAALLLLALLIATSFSWFNGPLRIWLDRLPPWSIYRMVQGATFLLNVSALIQSGMRLNVALTKLAANASPWLRVRIKGALAELAVGKNFGEALCDAGHHFPDKKANRFLSVIAAYSGIDVALAKFGHSWLEETVQKIQKVAKLILVCGVLMVGGTMLVVIAGAGGLQDSIQEAGE